MKELSLWFVYKHYTECFVHIKKCASHKLDTKLEQTDVLVLQKLDQIMREVSYVSSVVSGFLTTTAIAFFVSLNMNSELHRNRIVVKAILGAGVLFNIGKIMDWSSHVGLMFAFPRAFQVLDEGLTENCIVRKYNQEFYQEFREEIEKLGSQ